MANRGYLPTSHHLLTGFSPLTSVRGSSLSSSSNRSSSPPPEFAYDLVYPREQPSRRNSVSSREPSLGSYTTNRAPTSPGNTSLGMAYSSVQDFPYGLSGVQMPTYNFGSELYNYVSNGFPRKSRMCTFCNKVFTRSTTRRYHERRCPLLRASNSLAKNEENNQASSLSALKEQQSQQQQQRQKESPGGNSNSGRSTNSHHGSSLPRTLSSSLTNTTTAQSGVSVPQASPPLPSLHPAYPTSFSKSAAALVSSPSRSSAYNYPHPYGSHFYNTLSAAALASLDQNNSISSKHHHPHHHTQQQQESENGSLSWKAASVSPPTPNSKIQDQVNSFNSKLSSSLSGNGPMSLSKAFNNPETVVDLTARYCADFSLRTRPPVFPAPSLRAPPHSPPSPEPGETHNKFQGQGHHRYEDELARDGSGRDRDRDGDRENRRSSRDSPEGLSSLPPALHSSKLLWQINGGGIDRDAVTSSGYNAVMPPSSSLEVGRFRRQNSSPTSDTVWQGDKDSLEPREPFMKVDPLDEEDEDEFDDEEDEEEMEEDEEQFKSENNLGDSETVAEVGDGEGREPSSSKTKNASYADLVCQFCEKLFSDKVAKRAHEALHSQKKLYSCCLCPASFHCGYSLRVHTMRNHKEGPYKCKYCFLEYGIPSEFKTHLVKEHSLPKTECQSLKVFSVVTSDSSSPPPDFMLGGNAVSEGGYDDDNVTSDPNAFKHLRRSVDHTEEHYRFSEETTKALLSPNSISSASSTAVPAASVKSENDEDMEICKICNKSFSKSYIRLHERAHADQKPYECPICNKRFGYKNNMKSHMKLHQGLKPYQCQICGARFTRGSTLRRHGRRHNISNSAMLDYVLYNQRASGRGGGGASAVAAANLAHHKASMVPNSLLGAKSHYLLPNSHINTTSNNTATTTTNNSMPLSQLPPHHHHHHHQQQAQSSDTHNHSHHHLHSAITSKHSAFGAMPSMIPASATTLLNVGLDNERFNTGRSNGNTVKQRSPTHHLSPTGLSPGGVTSGHHNPFTSPNSIANPMVGGLAAVAAANLFGYPNAAANPHLYQLYASAAAANPLMGYGPYAATQNQHSVQSDALNLSLNKRKSSCEKGETVKEVDIDVDDDSGNGTTNCKHHKRVDEADQKISPRMSPTDDQHFVDSSSGVSSVSSDSKSLIKQEARIKEEMERLSSNEMKAEREDKNIENKNNFIKSSSLSLSLSPTSSPSSPNKSLSPNSNTKLDIGEDCIADSKQRQRHLCHENECDEKHHHGHYHHRHHRQHDDRDLKVSTEDFGAQVNICCPSPRVQSSTESVSEQHSPIPNLNNNSNSSNYSPVGSSSGPGSLPLHNPSANSPTGSGEASQASSPVDSNTAPSPTPNGEDQDALLSLLSSGRLFRCSFCDIYFTEYAMFRLHQKYHECDLDRPFLCAVCREDCKDKTYFTVHLSEHLGIVPKNGMP